MVQIPWPLTSSPGEKPQEGAGRLINVHVHRRGDDGAVTWKRAPGCTAFVVDPSAGSAIGSASALAVTSVGARDGVATGSATAAAVSAPVTLRSGEGAAMGSGTATGASAVKKSITGTATGSATATGESD